MYSYQQDVYFVTTETVFISHEHGYVLHTQISKISCLIKKEINLGSHTLMPSIHDHLATLLWVSCHRLNFAAEEVPGMRMRKRPKPHNPLQGHTLQVA